MSFIKRIGLIGCGNIWRIVYQPILASLSDRVQITAFCDRSPGTAASAAAILPEARRYDDPITLFREESLDAALVLTSENANASTALAALRAGLAVFLEKPPAISRSEWRQLTEADESETAAHRGHIYAAFNRRHTPLFHPWRLPADSPLCSVRGALTRQGRPVATFPYTAVHLIDSAQFFSGQRLTEFQIEFCEGETAANWNIRGRFEGGALCDLTFVPDGHDQSEYLHFETTDRIWRLHFPNGLHTEYAAGLLSEVPRDSQQMPITERNGGGLSANPLEALGHAPCFRDFLDRLEKQDWESSPHRLRWCESTVALLEEMLQSVRPVPALSDSRPLGST